MDKFEQLVTKREYLNIAMEVMEKTCQMLYSLHESGVSLPQEEKMNLLDSVKDAEKLAQEFFEEYMFLFADARATVEKL